MLFGILIAFLLQRHLRVRSIHCAGGTHDERLGVYKSLCTCRLFRVGDDHSDSQTFFAPGRVLHLPAPADLGRNVEWLQKITIHHGDDTFAFEGRISVTPERFHLVGLDGLGRRAMEVTWERNGTVVATRADWLPPQVKPGSMLADIVLLYWPRDVLRQSGSPLAPSPTGYWRDADCECRCR